DVETATHHTAAAVLEGAQSVAAQLAAGSGMRRLSGEIGSCQGVQAPRGDPAQALPSAAEGVQNKSALLLRDLEGQLHAVLHAFQERATRQVAEEFQNVAGGLLRREIEQLQTKGLTAELEQPLEGLRSEAQHGSSQAAGRRRDFPQGLADFWPKSSVQGFWRARRQTIPTENTGTPGGNAPKWRILGLG
ncbi:MAG: hypothetical protein ACRD10_05125, partial [Terriglobia bacterium]